jgi:hypothetical protein
MKTFNWTKRKLTERNVKAAQDIQYGRILHSFVQEHKRPYTPDDLYRKLERKERGTASAQRKRELQAGGNRADSVLRKF